MADSATRGISYIRICSSTRAHEGATARISSQRIAAYCELHRIALDATLIDKGMVTQGADGERLTVLDESLALLREGPSRLLIVPSVSHLALSVGKLARFIDEHFGDGSLALVAVAEGVDTRTDSGRFVLHLLRTLARWEGEVIGLASSKAK